MRYPLVECTDTLTNLFKVLAVIRPDHHSADSNRAGQSKEKAHLLRAGYNSAAELGPPHCCVLSGNLL
jgi:hypothetical protein